MYIDKCVIFTHMHGKISDICSQGKGPNVLKLCILFSCKNGNHSCFSCCLIFYISYGWLITGEYNKSWQWLILLFVRKYWIFAQNLVCAVNQWVVGLWVWILIRKASYHRSDSPVTRKQHSISIKNVSYHFNPSKIGTKRLLVPLPVSVRFLDPSVTWSLCSEPDHMGSAMLWGEVFFDWETDI